VKKALFVLSIAATLGAWLADQFLQWIPAFRNGWWSVCFFLVPLAALVLAWSPEKGKLGWGAVAVFALGLVGYVGTRAFYGNLSGTPSVAVGEKAPDFALKDADGREVELSEFTKGGRRVLLVFFRGKH